MHYENSLHKVLEHLIWRSESAKKFTSLKLYSKTFWTDFYDGSGALWSIYARNVWIFDRQEWVRRKVQFLLLSNSAWFELLIRKEIKPMAWFTAFYYAMSEQFDRY